MKKIASFLILLILSAPAALAQEPEIDPVSQQAADLEAQVRKLDVSSVEGANALLELVELYHDNARGFGLVRAGKAFVKAHRDHPRHKEIMLKLLDGYLILSRNEDVVSTSRQFLEFYGKDAASHRVARHLAEVLERQGKKMDAAKVYEQAWRLSGTKDQKSGFRAVRLFGEMGAGGAKDCGRLALEMLGKLKGRQALELGNYSFERCSHGNWNRKGCIALGEKIIAMNLVRDAGRKAEIHYVVAGHLWGTGQRVNALTHYRKAWDLQKDDEGYLYQLIAVTYDGSGKAAQLKPLVDEGPNDRADALEQRGVNALMDVVLPRFLKTEQRCNLVRRQRGFEDVEGGEAYLVPWPLAGVNPPSAIVPNVGRARLHLNEGQRADVHAFTLRGACRSFRCTRPSRPRDLEVGRTGGRGKSIACSRRQRSPPNRDGRRQRRVDLRTRR